MKTQHFMLRLCLCAYLLLGVVTPSNAQAFIHQQFHFYNQYDLRYVEEREIASVITEYPRPCNFLQNKIDYVSAHNILLHRDGEFRGNEGVVISKLIRRGKSCAQFDSIHQTVLDIHAPLALDPSETNGEVIYSLKVTSDLKLLGCGYYSRHFVCNTIVGPMVQVPFYFSWDLNGDSLNYLKRISLPLVDLCAKDSPRFVPVDLEELDVNHFVMGMSHDPGGIIIVNKHTGHIVHSAFFEFGEDQIFTPVDLEVVGNRIYALGRINHTQDSDPAILSADFWLGTPVMRRYPRSEFIPLHSKVSALKFNPETQTLMALGAEATSNGDPFVIRIDDLNTLEPEWTKVIDVQFSTNSSALVDGPLVFGMEYLRNLNRYVFHARGEERESPLKQSLFHHYLIDFDTILDSVRVSHLKTVYQSDDHNTVLLNNTLVQSRRTDHLALALPRDHESNDIENPINLFLDDEYYRPAVRNGCLEDKPVQIMTFTYSETLDVSSANLMATDSAIGADTILYAVENPINKCFVWTRRPSSGKRVDPVQPNTLLVYPNPAAEALTFDWTALDAVVKQVQVFSAQGRQVAAFSVESEQTVPELQVDGLGAGIYFARFALQDGSRQQVRFSVVK